MARTVGVVFGLFYLHHSRGNNKEVYGEIAWKTEVHTTDFHTNKTSHWSKFLS